jgi:hypothetical protein
MITSFDKTEKEPEKLFEDDVGRTSLGSHGIQTELTRSYRMQLPD